jgi:hypothetical protein
MPLLLTRYLLGELLRVLLLTAAVLVTVTAFGAAIKPLADDQLLSAPQAAKYIALAVVPMLQFALPFSAGFAATLALHRLATDNEITAMAASGLGYRRILAPVAALGLLLLLVMVALTQSVVPRFWMLLQRAAAVDVTRAFEASIRRHEAFQVGRLQIYADDILEAEPPPGSGITSRLVLYRGAAAELDGQGRMLADVTFYRGVVDVDRGPAGLRVALSVEDAVRFDQQAGRLARLERVQVQPFEVPTVLEDRLVTRTASQLRRLRREPERYGPVQRTRRALIDAVREQDLLQAMSRELKQGGGVDLSEIAPQPRLYRLRSGRLSGRSLLPVDGAVVVEEHRAGQPIRRYEAELGELARRAGVLGSGAIDLTLLRCRVVDLADEKFSNVRARVVIPGLAAPQPPGPELETLSCAALLAHVEGAGGLAGRAADGLRRAIVTLDRDVTERLAQRYALSATAPLLLLLGAVLAIWKRHSMPLHLYLWAFLPAIASLLVISGGSQLLRSGQWLGWIVMWSGNAGLMTMIAGVYARLRRN